MASGGKQRKYTAEHSRDGSSEKYTFTATRGLSEIGLNDPRCVDIVSNYFPGMRRSVDHVKGSILRWNRALLKIGEVTQAK
jgi:hypothetical protein